MHVLTSQTWTFHFFIVVLVIGDYFIGLETLYLAKQVGMINRKFAFIIFHLNHNFIRKATTPGLQLLWFLNYLNAKYRQVTSARGGGRREGALDFKWRGCLNGGKNQNPPKFLGLPTEPKNVMGPLLTSKAKKETLEVHSPLGWGQGEGHGPTLDGKALGAKFSERPYSHFKTSFTQTMSNALKHSLLQRDIVSHLSSNAKANLRQIVLHSFKYFAMHASGIS